MKILIVSATFLEIEPLLAGFRYEGDVNQKLKKYSYKNHSIDVLIPGVGMTCTAYWMGKTLAHNQYDVALNLGLAGSFKDEIAIGEVVNINSDRFADMGAEDGEAFLSLIDMDLLSDEDFPLNQGEIENTIILDNEALNKLRKAKAITVNKAHGLEDTIEKTMQLYQPDVESMEGGAFFYACLLEGITNAQIRAVSNKVEKRNKENWNIPLAVKNLMDRSLEIINTL